ncbi:hypothetical protein ACVWZM_001676 [Bradyrhizobium sp. USDA 4501]
MFVGEIQRNSPTRPAPRRDLAAANGCPRSDFGEGQQASENPHRQPLKNPRPQESDFRVASTALALGWDVPAE